MSKTVLIVGAGGALGAALTTEFSLAGYAVFGIQRPLNVGRKPAHSELLELHRCDLHDAVAIKRIATGIEDKHDSIDVLVYNAAHLVVKPFMDTTQDDFVTSWNASVTGAIISAQAVIPTMLKKGSGTMIFSGATASLRGTANFAAFAAAKFGLRGLTQSLAREYQSRGIHVAHVVIDGLLRGSASVKKFGGDERNTIDPVTLASTYRWLAEQPKSAWTLELDTRPSAERF